MTYGSIHREPTPAQVVDRHSGVTYYVYMLGFLPGLGPPVRRRQLFRDPYLCMMRADHPTISRLGLRAYVYGGVSDYIADPSENAPFAAALRAAGADAHSAVYPGEHDFAMLESHLEHMLTFAGRGGGPITVTIPKQAKAMPRRIQIAT